MSIYTSFIYDNKLISPVNGYECRRITKQNIRQFGFDSLESLLSEYPDFPLTCTEYRQNIGKDINGLKRKGIDRYKQEMKKSKRESYKLSPKICPSCSDIIPFENRTGNFCSVTCKPVRVDSQATRDKRNASIRETNKKKNANKSDVLSKLKECAVCKTSIAKHRITCSHACKSTYRKLSATKMTKLQRYRQECAFKFNVYDFPDYFDLQLITLFGWYKPKNRGDNLNGISRDHIFSIRDGFDKNIDPSVLAHPANCSLLRHRDNSSKGRKSQISIEDLMERIAQWNFIYGEYRGG